MIGVGVIALLSAFLPGKALLLAPIGASAVLAFAVPASPLAQPWPVVGGNTVSAMVGAGAVAVVGDPAIAAVIALPVAILVMTLTRSLHPPGGAVALLGALSGSQVLAPIAIDSILLVGTALLFHRFSGHAYPHRPDPIAARRELAAEGLIPDDLDRAIEDLHETFDISREDLAVLLARAEHHASERRERTLP